MQRFLPILAMSIALACTASAVEITAHRGASFDAPENTLSSFRLGWEQGADSDELDIYLTKDNQIIVIHDASTKRTAGVDKKVVEQTLAELRALDAGSWKGSQWAGEKLPTLQEAIATIPAGKRLFIEIKCGPEIVPELQRVLAESGKKPEQLVIIGFGYEVVKAAKQAIPSSKVYWLVSPKKGSEGASPTVTEMVEKAKAAGVDGLDLDSKFPIDAAFAKQVKDAGLELYAWTVDDPALAKRLVEAGVNGITTNRPAFLREQLK